MSLSELRLLFQQIRLQIDERWTPPEAKTKLHHSYSQSKLARKDYSRGADSDSTSSDDGNTEETEGPDYQKDLKWQAISAFAFLRFIVRSIINPHLFGLVEGMPPPAVSRTLILIAQHIQRLANLNLVSSNKAARIPISSSHLHHATPTECG